MRVNKIYGLCALQFIGFGVQGINRMAGNFVIFICSVGVILYVIKLDIDQSKFRAYSKCKVKIPKKICVCPECECQYRPSVREVDVIDMIEHGCDEVECDADRIDCDFEKIEEVAVDMLTSYDRDIQEFLIRRR